MRDYVNGKWIGPTKDDIAKTIQSPPVLADAEIEKRLAEIGGTLDDYALAFASEHHPANDALRREVAQNAAIILGHRLISTVRSLSAELKAAKEALQAIRDWHEITSGEFDQKYPALRGARESDPLEYVVDALSPTTPEATK